MEAALEKPEALLKSNKVQNLISSIEFGFIIIWNVKVSLGLNFTLSFNGILVAAKILQVF